MDSNKTDHFAGNQTKRSGAYIQKGQVTWYICKQDRSLGRDSSKISQRHKYNQDGSLGMDSNRTGHIAGIKQNRSLSMD